MSDAHWHILGAGAIGCLFAARLQQAGAGVTLLLREPASDEAVELLLEQGEQQQRLQLPASNCLAQSPISHLLVCTKAYDVAAAVDSVAHRLNPDSQVLLLANGMGFDQPLVQNYPWMQLYYGTTTEGAYRLAPRHIRHAGRGQTRLGRPGQEKPAPWFATWPRALQHCHWEADMEQALWAKLAINCAINPLTAIHQCRNGELEHNPQLAAQVSALCAEIAAVCTAAGYTGLATGLHREVQSVIRSTANNQSSMLQDVQNARPTEIDYITGHLLAVAARHGIATPRNSTLFTGVKALGT